MLSRFFAILLFVALLAPSLASAADLRASFVPTNPPQPMPPMVFNDGEGRAIALKDLKGRFVVLNIWATWCGPCAHEMPGLDALYQKLDAKIFAIVALTEDHDGQTAAEFFFSRHAISHLPIYVDTSGRAPSSLKVRGMPTTILIDPNGFEIGRVEGEADWAAPDALTFLQEKIKR